jgi:hypothetical protein
VSEPALSIAFFDPDRQLHGTARSGATVLFEERTPTALPDGPAFEQRGDTVRAELGDRLSLALEPVSPAAELGEVTARICRVTGQVLGKPVEGLGTVGETRSAPEWEELDALRTISVLVDAENGMLALARRPRGARGHGDELVSAALIHAGELLAVDDARLSTVYDGDGRQRSAGLELWLPGEEFARRGSGTAVAGTSLELEGLAVHIAIFHWRIEGAEGYGAYELMVREPAPVAA